MNVADDMYAMEQFSYFSMYSCLFCSHSFYYSNNNITALPKKKTFGFRAKTMQLFSVFIFIFFGIVEYQKNPKKNIDIRNGYS